MREMKNSHSWRISLWKGILVSKGWYWATLTVVLNIFTTASIVSAIASGKGLWIAAVIAGIVLVILVVLVVVQAPYRGQLAFTKEAEAERDTERENHKQTQEKLKPFMSLKQKQNDSFQSYLHLIMMDFRVLSGSKLVIQFGIASGLLDDFHPTKLCVMPIIGGFGSKWQDTINNPSTILGGKRTIFESRIVEISDSELLPHIELMTKGQLIAKGLRILVEDESRKSFELEASFLG